MQNMARMKSCIAWLEGDTNTRLFHAQASEKSYIANIIADDGEVLTAHENKAHQVFFSFYSGLWNKCT